MALFRRLLKPGSSPARKMESTTTSKDQVDALSDQTASLSVSDNQDVEIATFALSWFWFPEAQFGCVPGVVGTRVGFTGGKKKGPTYYSLWVPILEEPPQWDHSVVSIEVLVLLARPIPSVGLAVGDGSGQWGYMRNAASPSMYLWAGLTMSSHCGQLC